VATTSSLSAAFALALSIALTAPPAFAHKEGSPCPAGQPRTKVGVARTLTPDAALRTLARSLDAVLEDAARDLGFTMLPPAPEGPANDPERLEEAINTWHSTPCSHLVRVTLRAVAPDAVELRLVVDEEVRVEHVAQADVAVRAVALLRDVLRAGPVAPPPAPVHAPAERLAGRITLMANSAAFGGLVGFSIQKASGSDDPRLLVPLTIVGAGIGLGAAYVASGEWEVGTGDAWFFAAGAWWGTAAGHLVFQGRFAATRQDQDRWVFGLVGGGLGASLATLGVAVRDISDAGAVVANAGGAAGLGLGALVELGARRSTAQVPYTGMGYGAALGWLAAATVAVNVPMRFPGKHLAGMPQLGVIGESSVGLRRAPIVGVGYAGSLP
jgi:hypothetical protein